ncbi:MAG: tyrosine-type recombinase/integrase [Bdellovibrionales bacterium]|nr:tyrosine-type recombinase/integrase [Bdellovibrionales bacterium]
MKPWRVHDLRQSFAHNYLKSGGEMYELKAILGHKSIQMTVDLYGNFQAEDVSKVSPYEF